MMKIILLVSAIIMATSALAGGDPEFVHFPADYKETDIHYATLNRVNGTQLAVLYANTAAVNSIQYGDELIPGSRIIMEIYKAKKNTEGDFIKDSEGLFERGDLAAIAVMEKSIDWSSNFTADNRADEWGFALYDPAGKAKTNELECAACHTPLQSTDEMFSHAQLKIHANQ